MADRAPALRRTGPLGDRKSVAFAPLPSMTRLAARGGEAAARRFGEAFGVELPLESLRARTQGERAALWLGPDEWLLLAPEDDGLAKTIEAGLHGEPGCIVDISHRQIGLDVTGAGAAVTLNAGCPLDLALAAFPVGMCTRTILGKADIVLWRRDEDQFRLECWRSFAPYVFDLLKQAAADCGF